MNDELIKALIIKAKRSYKASKRMLEEGYDDFSVSRSYYTMFYCMEALLLTKDLKFHRHSAVLAAFGKEFVKTKLFPSDMHTSLNSAFDLRNAGDYEAMNTVSAVDAELVLKESYRFVQLSEQYLKSQGYDI